MRYRRQTHELIVPLPAGAIDDAAVRELVERFERTYEDTYGKGAGFREAGIEITTFRVDGDRPHAQAPPAAAHTERRQPDATGSARCIDEHSAELVDPRGGRRVGRACPLGERVLGPAVVEHPDHDRLRRGRSERRARSCTAT